MNMRYVQRNAEGQIVAHYANEQSYATEQLASDHPELVDWEARRRPDRAAMRFRVVASDERIKVLEERVESLAAEVAALRCKRDKGD